MLKKFQSHKVVEAAKIIDIRSPSDPTSNGVLKLEGHFGITVRASYFERHEPKVGGYYVKYPDGYESYSPAEPFESGYTPFDESRIDAPGDTRDQRIAELEAKDAAQAHKIADLEMALEDAARFVPKGAAAAAQMARIPENEIVRLGAFPFRLLSDAIVEGTQAHVNEVLEEEHRPRERGVAGSATGEANTGDNESPSARAPYLQQFLERHNGEKLTVVSHKGTTAIRLATIDQADAFEGVVRGNIVYPIGG